MKNTSLRTSPTLGEGGNSIIIYTDGSSLGNPGPGGYGCVIVFQEFGEVVELGGYARETTNNKMELTAIIKALEYVQKHLLNTVPHPNPPLHKGGKHTNIVIHTDSSYAINGITKWIFGWQKNNWITSTKTPVLNSEIWKQLIPLKNHFKNLSFEHVKGHSGIWGNERCDMIATSFASKTNINLFHGKLTDYDSRILDKTVSYSKKYPTLTLPYIRERVIQVSQKTKPIKKSGKAYSYVAQVNGNVYTFEDWDSCKAAVYGRSAKYKKVFSEQEEQILKKEWGGK
jgi:ribonuclease HI